METHQTDVTGNVHLRPNAFMSVEVGGLFFFRNEVVVPKTFQIRKNSFGLVSDLDWENGDEIGNTLKKYNMKVLHL